MLGRVRSFGTPVANLLARLINNQTATLAALHGRITNMDKPLVTGGLSLPRRGFLKGAAALGALSVFPAIITRSARAAGAPTVVNSIRSLSNPYHATWNKGGAAFAKSGVSG